MRHYLDAADIPATMRGDTPDLGSMSSDEMAACIIAWTWIWVIALVALVRAAG